MRKESFETIGGIRYKRVSTVRSLKVARAKVHALTILGQKALHEKEGWKYNVYARI
ncbi:MAG: hypothetical protein WC998_05485 [Candidatus Paceibacterota bacterium]|jgi:hypothetical protein